MARNDQVRRFLALLNTPPADLDEAKQQALEDLAVAPEVVEVFGQRAAWALAELRPPPERSGAVRRAFELLDLPQAAMDDVERAELRRLATHPEVVGLVGLRALKALSGPQQALPLPQVLVMPTGDGAPRDAHLTVSAAVLTVGFWHTVSQERGVVHLTRDEYMQTMRAMLADLKATQGGNDGRQRPDGATGGAVAGDNTERPGNVPGEAGGGEGAHLREQPQARRK